jgi:hypothetical protein
MKTKNNYILLTLGIITTTIILFTSFDSQDIHTTINNAIKNGNAGQLSSYFNSTVEMNVLGNEGYFSKSQATSVLTEFFKNNPPQSFDVKQGGSTTENTKFSIGNYKTNAGLFKIYYVVKKENNAELIHKFTIEKK